MLFNQHTIKSMLAHHDESVHHMLPIWSHYANENWCMIGYHATSVIADAMAKNVGDFWKRWHMSLSSWLKDYLYIPLGGNKKGTIGSYMCIAFLSVVLVMLTGKIWLLLVLLFIAIIFVLLAYFFPKVKQSVKYITYKTNITCKTCTHNTPT